jgi:hypothetical protein
MSLSLSRRALLKSLGFAAAASIPVFRPGILHAEGPTAIPKRFLSFVHFCGTIPGLFFPTQTVADAPLSAAPLPQLLAPIERFKSKLLVIKGLRIASAIQAGGSHTRGMVTVLSGNNEAADGKAGAQTIDHFIGNAVGASTPFRSLQFAVNNRYGGGISWTGPSQSAPPMQDPALAFDRAFAKMTLPKEDPAALARIRARRQSIFDHVSGELSALAPSLSDADRKRVEAHLESVREVEKRVQNVSSVACVAPTLGPKLDPKLDADAPAIGRLHMDMIAAAFACDLTRSATMQFSRGTSTMTFPHLGIAESHHDCSHLKPEIPDVLNKLTKINVFYAEQFAYLLGKLDAVRETDGKTLLDHSLVWWSSEVGTGGHSLDNLPCVVAGGAGAFRMGRSLVVPKQPHNALLLAIARTFVPGTATFGTPEYCAQGPLNLA